MPFLRTASPERLVRSLPAPAQRSHPVPSVDDPVIRDAFSGGPVVLRLPPAADDIPVIQEAASLGDALVVCPSRTQAARLAGRLRRAGVPTSLHPDGWGPAAGGGVTVVGTRASIWAPLPQVRSIVVFDEHDEVHQEERSPTWHVREVAIERARRADVPCVLTSPMPSIEALELARLVTVQDEREDWPRVVVADRRDEDVARNALFTPALTDLVRGPDRIVCVLNQKGRAALLACDACQELARCDRCDAAMARPDDGLRCRRCGHQRPVVCASCGSTRLKTVRMGVSRVRDDLEALAHEPGAEVTSDVSEGELDDVRLIVGTEAVLHRVDRADVVAFLDFDQELYAPRYRAAEQALALLVRAARLVGGRRGRGRLLVQTRRPEHEVVQAALHGRPELVSDAERARRVELGFPPAVALAELGGDAGEAFATRLRELGRDDVAVLGPVDGRWRVSAPDHRSLCDALDAVERPTGRLRLSVDPLRI